VWQATQTVEKICWPERVSWADAGFDSVIPTAMIAAAVIAIAANPRSKPHPQPEALSEGLEEASEVAHEPEVATPEKA
jgi:hypothetical protein